MQRPQLVQSRATMTRVDWSTPRSAGVITWGSGQTSKQSPQSLHASLATAAMRTGDATPSIP